MSKDDTATHCTVTEHEGHFDVSTHSGRVLMSCRDEASAAHYATLLNSAYASGYKQGYRDARNR